jgi:hypothetical protein
MTARHRGKVAAAVLVATAMLGAGATDALGRRMTDYKCTTPTGGVKLCGQAAHRESRPDALAPKGPIVLVAQKTCRSNNILVVTRATNPAQVRRVTLRLDGVIIGETTRARPHFVGVGVDCASLAVGEHTLSATLIRRDGTSATVSQTLTRLDGPSVDWLD